MDGGKPNVIDLGKYTVERIREIAVLHGECVKPGTKEERGSVFRMACLGMCVLGIISHFDIIFTLTKVLIMLACLLRICSNCVCGCSMARESYAHFSLLFHS